METGYEQVLGSAEATLDAVDGALRRLADGSYGVCAECGRPIAEERLSEQPTATTCDEHPS